MAPTAVTMPPENEVNRHDEIIRLCDVRIGNCHCIFR
jgi:hypothetical protein